MAQDRATLYQQGVRAALRERGWSITQEAEGKLTAERLKTDQGGTTGFHLYGSLNNYARLQINFRADGKNHTTSSAYASLCVYGPLNTNRKEYLEYPPLALRDPKLTQEYRDVLAEAETHLGVGTSGKIAMK